MQNQESIDITFFDKRCHTITDNLFNILPLRNIKWRNDDHETLQIIVNEYHYIFRRQIQKLRETGVIVGSSLIQAGGNSGLYPLLFTSLFNPVITFEPNPLNFHCLVNNCQMNNVIKFNAAVGAKNGKIRSVENFAINSGMNTVEEIEEGNDYIPMVMIDSFEFDDVGMMQLDVEGFEMDALEGAKKTIKKNRPVLMIETIEPGKVEKFLSKFSYRLLQPMGNEMDYIYVPKERI
jgi:FkbM family methyltransferase